MLAALFVVLEHVFASRKDPGMTGLMLTYSLTITGLLSGIITTFTDTEQELVAVCINPQMLADLV